MRRREPRRTHPPRRDAEPADEHVPPRRPIPRVWIITAAISVVCIGLLAADWWRTIPSDTVATYVGRSTCIQCHQRQGELWQGSHHDLAMDHATSETVLGDFNDASLDYLGVTARMFRRDEKYFVHTEGPDGELDDFEVKYVLGVAPLQQYMVEFDRAPDQPAHEIGRVQVLRESWDVERKRWFYLAPPDVLDKLSPDDELHWTGTAQRWNTMCADCHSTNLRRNFDVASATYHTTYSEIDVSCEACHGPGSTHVQLAQSRRLFWDRKLGYGLPRLKGADSRPQIETCAPCHSRRHLLTDETRPGDPFHQGHANELLGELTYYADGQIRDEVYEYGSFLQSKMYHKGIKCSDCHDPHSARLKHQGNKLCTSCHAHSPGKYDGPAHTHHQPGSPGASCVECHMPETTYMAVDPRRDHSLRVPRPGLSVELGTPNSCTRCHLQVDKVAERLPAEKRVGLDDYAHWLERRASEADVKGEVERVDRWARDKALVWWGAEKMDDAKHFAHVLHAARTDPRAAEPRLIRLVTQREMPAIVQATALMHLGTLDTAASLKAARQALSAVDPQVRAAAILRYETQLIGIGDLGADPQQVESMCRPLVRDLEPLLSDSVRLVRFEAARQLARVPDPVLRAILLGDEHERFEGVVKAYVEGMRTNNDRGSSYRNLAQLYENRGQLPAAQAAYQTAIELEPRAAGARSGLALLLDRWVANQTQRRQLAAEAGDQATVEQLTGAIATARAEMVRLRRQELPLLERDARLLPQLEMIQYRYAMALYLSGDESRAESTLLALVAAHPKSERAIYALALLYHKQQRWTEAEQQAGMLVTLRPGDATFEQLTRDLKSRKEP